MEEICDIIEGKVASFSASGDDYFTFLQNQAIDEGVEAFFLGSEFMNLVQLVKNHEIVNRACHVKLGEFVRALAQEEVNKLASALLLLWPFMHRFSPKEAKVAKQNKEGAAPAQAPAAAKPSDKRPQNGKNQNVVKQQSPVVKMVPLPADKEEEEKQIAELQRFEEEMR